MTQGERVKAIRKSEKLNLTLEQFGDKIGLKKSAMSLIENDKNTLTDSNIKSICREFGVNKEWLLTGEGEMFRSLTRSQTITDFMGDLVVDDTSFKARLIEALAKLDESEWETLEKIAKDIVQNGGS